MFLQVYMNDRGLIEYRVLQNNGTTSVESWEPMTINILWTYSSKEELQDKFPEFYSLVREYEISN